MRQPRAFLALALALLAAATGAHAGSPSAPEAMPRPFAGLGLDETLAGASVLTGALEPRPASPVSVPALWVRLVVARQELEPSPGVYSLDALERRLAGYREHGLDVILTVADPPRTVDAADGWRALVRELAGRTARRVRAVALGDPARDDEIAPDPAAYAFLLKIAATELHAADPGVLVLEAHPAAADAAWVERLLGEETAPYLDGIAIRRGALDEASGGAGSSALARLTGVLERDDPGALRLVFAAPLGDEPKEAARRALVQAIADRAEGVPVTTFAATRSPRAVVAAERGLRELFARDLVTLDERASGLRIGGPDAPQAVPHRLLYDPERGTTWLAYWPPPGGTTDRAAGGSIDVEIRVATARPPRVHDPLAEKAGGASRFERDEAAGVSRLTVPLLDRLVLVELAAGDETKAQTSVTADAGPSVEDIVARHQAVHTAQTNALLSYSANVLTEIHFRPSASDSGYDVVLESRFYWDPVRPEWEELSFRLNGAKWGANRPAFPLLQPERVLSLPLELDFRRDYRYRLHGVETAAGRPCYAVGFEPLDASRSLYRGRIWIDAATFSRVKVQAVQTNLAPPVTASEEIQTFGPAEAPGGQPLDLLQELTSRQLYLIAGRTVAVEKKVTFSDFAVNDSTFTARREAARTSDHIMLGETEKGLRYLVKRGGERVVNDTLTTNAKAAALGVNVDPSYDYPLPIAGINYLNFDLFHRDVQLAMLFGGVIALGNVQKPKLFGTSLDMSADVFAIAVKGTDKLFDRDGELERERIRSRPFSTGLNLGYQVSSFVKLLGGYQFRFDHYSRDADAAPEFLTPESTATHGVSAGFEFKRAGWTLVAGASSHRRAGWRAWGDVGEFDPDTRRYTKWNATLGRDVLLKTFQKLHLDVGWYGGRRLDRFSRYQLGLFDETKMHGVPSGAARFEDLFLVRGSYSFNVFDQFRLDLYVDHGRGRDPERSGGRAGLTGTGLGLNVKGPWSTIIRTDVGKSFLPAAYRGAGSVVFQLLILKPL